MRAKKLFLFAPERMALSMERLAHYCGTPAESFQRYVLFTNYAMHVEEFRTRFPDAEGPERPGVQMPAWHHRTPDQDGVTIVDIGVGPSNAKTVTDHLAVLRPDAMLMIGHCAGLRNHQDIGDYVLATVVPARRPHPRPRAAHDDPGHPEPSAELVPPRRARRAPGPLPDRHRAHDREPQLGARDQGDGAHVRAVACGRRRHGVGDDRRERLPLPHPERDAAVHLRQAAARRAQARRAGQAASTTRAGARTSRSRSSASTASGANTRPASRTPTSAARASRSSARPRSNDEREMT